MEERKRWWLQVHSVLSALGPQPGVKTTISILHSFSPREALATVPSPGSQSLNSKQGQGLCSVALITELMLLTHTCVEERTSLKVVEGVGQSEGI